MTPFGKITVLKTNVLSKCIHLLLSIERSETFFKATNKVIFNFLWDGKQDKIKRSIMVSEYMSGGMKMIDIYNFQRALKVNWIKILSQKKSLWNLMFEQIYKSYDKVIQFGDQWCLKMLHTIKNPFWKDVVTDWALLSQKQQIITNSDILPSCLWYNSKMHKGDVFHPSWD